MCRQDCDVKYKIVQVARMIIHRASVRGDMCDSVNHEMCSLAFQSVKFAFKIRQGIRARRIRRGTGTRLFTSITPSMFVLTARYRGNRRDAESPRVHQC